MSLIYGTPLVRAAAFGLLPIVKYLTPIPSVDVNAGDERETTPLIWASMQGFLNIVEYLCSVKGIDLNAMDEYVCLLLTLWSKLCSRGDARTFGRY